MKIILSLVTACYLLLLGCSLFSSKEPIRDFIPGTYCSEWTTEFTEARDTMLIEPLTKEGSSIYQIIRRTYMLYQKKPQYKLVHWTGTFNSGNETIIINNNGRILSFDPANKEMKMGSTTYKKLLP
jgi:hypothetical protein